LAAHRVLNRRLASILILETAAFSVKSETASRELAPASTTRGEVIPMKMTGKIVAVLALYGLVAAAARPAIAADSGSASNEKKFTVVAEQVGKSKWWFPSNIMVNQGDKVTLVLKNEIEGADITHGFELDGYDIKEVVTRGVPKTVTFTADKPGIFHYYCQLHPAHIGGDLLVVPSK
jgi:nitrosocyanin